MRLRALMETVYRDLRGKETTPRADAAHLDAAVEWLYRAQDATDSDGCAATYNLVLGWEPAYPETTGYIVPTLYDYAETAEIDLIAMGTHGRSGIERVLLGSTTERVIRHGDRPVLSICEGGE